MTVGGTKLSPGAKLSLGVRGGARWRVACALSLVAALTNACGGRSRESNTRDGATGSESGTNSGGMVPDSGTMAAAGGAMAADAGMPSPCAGQTAGGSSLPVTGTIRGAGVDAVLSQTGLETTFIGPDAPASRTYAQSFGPGYDAAGKPVDEFAFAKPSDVVTASFSGWAGATAAEVGSYRSQGCGAFVFEMAFPIPPGVACPSKFGPCGPQCEGVGEAGICQPALPKRRYRAWRETPCFPSGAAGAGEWQLELTSVCSQPIAETLINFKTHGHLNAILVNEADASDSVEVNLDF